GTADARATARALLVYEGGRRREPDARTFPATRLAPVARLGSAGASSMVAVPLFFGDRRLGFALFEVGPRSGWVYRMLQDQLSSALQAALLAEREHRA